jgi:hypothetical protein
LVGIIDKNGSYYYSDEHEKYCRDNKELLTIHIS